MEDLVMKSTGWYLILDRKFNVLIPQTITEAQLFECVNKKLISRNEYIQILANAWESQTHTEAEFRSWVVSGHITADEFEALTQLVY